MTYGHQLAERRAIDNRNNEGPHSGACTVWSQYRYQQPLLYTMATFLLISTIELKGFAHLKSNYVP